MAIPETVLEPTIPDRAETADTDRADVALAAAGDAAAFERLYRRHVGRVHSVACRIVGSELAGR